MGTNGQFTVLSRQVFQIHLKINGKAAAMGRKQDGRAALVPLSDVAAELIKRGLWARFDAPSPGHEPVLISAEVLAHRAQLAAEQYGVAITEGWHGHPCVTAAGADLILAEVALAAEAQREREARDAEASAAAEAAQRTAEAGSSYVSLGETLQFMSPQVAERMLRAQGTRIPFPGVITTEMGRALQAQRLAGSGMMPDGDFPRALYPGGSMGVAVPSDE